MLLLLLASGLSERGVSARSYGWTGARVRWPVTHQTAAAATWGNARFLAGAGGPLPGWGIPWGIPSLAASHPLHGGSFSPSPGVLIPFPGAAHQRAGGDHAQPQGQGCCPLALPGLSTDLKASQAARPCTFTSFILDPARKNLTHS